jgi:hypothetical protein
MGACLSQPATSRNVVLACRLTFGNSRSSDKGEAMHPTIERLQEVVAKGDDSLISELLAEDVRFMPPTYYSTWTGRAPVAAVLGHVGQVFSDFSYRRIMGQGKD